MLEGQPSRFQGLLSSRPLERARRDLGWVWSGVCKNLGDSKFVSASSRGREDDRLWEVMHCYLESSIILR